MKMARVFCVPFVLIELFIVSALGQKCCFHVDPSTRQLVDAFGRARIFHGMNVVYKSFPYHPVTVNFDPELSLSGKDIEFFKHNGFNVVRLYVAWPGVEPFKGSYNQTYLSILSDIVNKLGDSGIYTILDCHQDLWSPKFCGEGAPDYAALYLNRSTKPLPFPIPIPSLSAYKVDPKTGYPYRNECSQHPFFTYYFSDAVGKAWQSFFDNEQEIQDQFAMFWQQVAKAFSTNPYVLGYELLNEPWIGDVYGHPDHLEPHVSDRKNLMPLYQKLHSSIREVDENHIIFFEPTVITTNLPFKEFSSTGLTSGPGGVKYNDRQVFSYHMYCILIDSNGQPLNTRLCDKADETVVDIRMSDAQRLGVAGFMTEWGAYGDETVPGSRPYEDGLELTGLADKYLQSWTYWQYKGYGDFTTQSSTAEGLYFANGTIQESKVKMLSRTYAQAVSGRYVSQKFDPENGKFSVSFVANATLAPHPTIIYVNRNLYYPNGFDVSIAPPSTTKYTVGHNVVYVTLLHTMDGMEITVNIDPKSN